MLACDPHLQKTMQQTWYLTRVSWNATDPETGEEYKTYLMGASFVTQPSFTYARSPFGSIGVTSLNPDISDLFAEKVKVIDGRE